MLDDSLRDGREFLGVVGESANPKRGNAFIPKKKNHDDDDLAVYCVSQKNDNLPIFLAPWKNRNVALLPFPMRQKAQVLSCTPPCQCITYCLLLQGYSTISRSTPPFTISFEDLKENTGKFELTRQQNVIDAKIKVIGTSAGLFRRFLQRFVSLAQATERGLRVVGHAAPFVGQLRRATERKELRVGR